MAFHVREERGVETRDGTLLGTARCILHLLRVLDDRESGDPSSGGVGAAVGIKQNFLREGLLPISENR